MNKIKLFVSKIPYSTVGSTDNHEKWVNDFMHKVHTISVDTKFLYVEHVGIYACTTVMYREVSPLSD
jgi:hypothetical protein